MAAREARRAARLIVGLIGLTTPLSALALGCTGTGEPARVAAVEARLELRLDDGRLVRLAGFDPPTQTPTTPDLEDRSIDALAGLIVGKPASLDLVARAPDRWGRLVATIAVTADGSDLATTAIAAGLGRYKAETAAHPCRAALLAAEDGARRSKLGLWADPYYAVLAVDDRAAFAERAGTIVVAQGRLTAVVPSPFRTRLRFAAPDGSHAGHTSSVHDPMQATLSATVLPHTMKTFEAQRMTFSSLIGRTLRWRGLLDTRFGPTVELAGPDDVELLPDGEAASSASAATAPSRPN